MKKVLFTLNVCDYPKEITDLTYPYFERYAEKIGAEFQIISERKYPDWPIDYEKMQIYDLGKNNDWNIYIDSDTILHPDFWDITNYLSKEVILHNSTDMAGLRWKYDKYFLRDARHISSANWFAIASDWCIDLWHPLDDLTLEQALANMYPTNHELKSNGRCNAKEHLITDYVLSRNIAKYGLKLVTTKQLGQQLGWLEAGHYLWHQYTYSNEQKVDQIRGVLKEWNL
jgi:hypothetical protein